MPDIPADERLIPIARAVAIAAHAGQTDKAGEPYYLHPQRVAEHVRPPDPVIISVAWLHDVLEDTNVTSEALRAIGIPQRVVLAVEALTRRDDETYAAFIERVAIDPIAKVVKHADLADNLDPERRWQPGQSHRDRYLRAVEYLHTH